MSHRQWIAALAFGCATLSGAAFAQAPPAEQAPVGSGPYPALMEAAPGLPTHTLYRPADLSALGDQQLPIVVWGNGACANAGNSFRAFLTELASYGYFIVANGPIDPEWPNSQQRPVIRPDGVRELPPPATRSSQLIEAIDWAFAQASRRNGDFRGRLDTSEVAVMGMSCGGVQALEASADRRVTTTMIWNSGMPERGTSMAGGRPLTKDDLNLLHAPIAYIVGDHQDQAQPNAADDFQRLNLPVFFGWMRGVPHGGTYRQPNGGEFAGVAIAWLNWQTKDDARAGLMFVGEDCGLCVNPRWVTASKNLQ